MSSMVLGRTTPTRSMTQRLEALEVANEIRSYRANLKRDLKARRRSIGGVLLADDPMLDTMKVFELLIAAPRFGRVKVNRILSKCSISPSKTVGGLTHRQRAELLLFLAA